ncbi:hypothetical protein IKG06_03135 [Candidatus Saccharibacteria bacterium]|nr:hypothetical protein [Candidatus Saccharibacteria bacterium]
MKHVKTHYYTVVSIDAGPQDKADYSDPAHIIALSESRDLVCRVATALNEDIHGEGYAVRTTNQILNDYGDKDASRQYAIGEIILKKKSEFEKFDHKFIGQPGFHLSV